MLLMEVSSSWSQMYSAAQEMPKKCFDGYFAEGISDALVRKMGQDWAGFITILRKHKDDKRFFPLVLGSINETVLPKDIAKVKDLAEHSCPADISANCARILKTIRVQIGHDFWQQ